MNQPNRKYEEDYSHEASRLDLHRPSSKSIDMILARADFAHGERCFALGITIN